MPELVRMYIRNVAIGVVLAVVFTGLLLGLNVANLRHLVMASEGGYVAILMLVVFNAIVFGGVQFALAVMRLADDDDKDQGGRRDAIPALLPASVPVPARARRR